MSTAPLAEVVADRDGVLVHTWGAMDDVVLHGLAGRELRARLPKGRPCVTFFDGAEVVCRCGSVRIMPLHATAP